MTSSKHLKAYAQLAWLLKTLKDDGADAPSWDEIIDIVDLAATVFDPTSTALLDTNHDGKPILEGGSDYILRGSSFWVENDEEQGSIWVRSHGEGEWAFESYDQRGNPCYERDLEIPQYPDDTGRTNPVGSVVEGSCPLCGEIDLLATGRPHEVFCPGCEATILVGQVGLPQNPSTPETAPG